MARIRDQMLASVCLVLVVFFVLPTSPQPQCPNVCSCKWINGKKTASCIGQNLISIPSGISSDVQVLYLTKNSLSILPSRGFQDKGLVNVQKIYLSESKLGEIAPDAFLQLGNLVEIDLSANFLTSVPSEAFKECPRLRRLLLNQNPIRRINSDVFATLYNLTSLEMSECQIETIEKGAFNGLKKLEHLKIDGNKLTTLAVEVLQVLPPLYSLALDGNPWNCDCNLRDVRMWIAENNIPVTMYSSCFEPARLHGLKWSELDLDDFACPPLITSTRKELVEVMHRNATIVCSVRSIPDPSIYWQIGDVVFNNFSSRTYQFDKYIVEEDRSSQYASILTIVNVDLEDSGSYICHAENRAGNTYENFTLTVRLPPLPPSGWSKTTIAGTIIGVFMVIIVTFVIVSIIFFRQKGVRSDDDKCNGMNLLKQLAAKKSDYELNEKQSKDLAVSEKPPRQETGSSGYGSDQQTPDLNTKMLEMNGGYLSSKPDIQNNPLEQESYESESLRMADQYNNQSAGLIHADNYYPKEYGTPSYQRYADYDSYPDAPPSNTYNPYDLERTELTNQTYYPTNDHDPVTIIRGSYEPVSESASLRDESYHSYNSPVHQNWKRTPIVMPNSPNYHGLVSEGRYSPDEGYAEEALEGTEV